MRQTLRVLVVLLGLGGWTPVNACPECAEGIRVRVRQGIYGDGFGFNLGAVVLPFGVFLAITALIHPGLPTRRRGDAGEWSES